MIRKLVLLAVLALAAMATSVSTASAAQVHNPGMYYLTGQNLFLIVHHPIAGEIISSNCVNDWEANISANGHVDIHDVQLDPNGGTTPNCEDLNDCDDLGWEGQITSQHSVHADFCLEGVGVGIGDVNAEATCSTYREVVEDPGPNHGDEIHCESSIATESDFALPLEIEGELYLRDAEEDGEPVYLDIEEDEDNPTDTGEGN